MAVHAPKSRFNTPVPAIPAGKAETNDKKGPHKFSKALTHHGAAGAALKAGNAQQAMHHLGHMMLAIRSASKPTGATSGMVNPAMSDGSPMGGPSASDGTDDSQTTNQGPVVPGKAPVSSMNRGIFASMKKKK